MRGRVGRSHHQAYAWLLTPHPKAHDDRPRKNAWKRSPRWKIWAQALPWRRTIWRFVARANCWVKNKVVRWKRWAFHSIHGTAGKCLVDALKAGREPSLEDPRSNQTEVELRMPATCCLRRLFRT
ncbi:hypothetical protein WDV93_18790 [Pantoea ananatis]